MSMVKEELISTLAAPVSVHSVSKYASTFTCKRKHDTALSCCGCLFDSRFVLPASWVFQKGLDETTLSSLFWTTERLGLCRPDPHTLT